MKLSFHRLRRGFTLIEMSIAIMVGMATGSMVLALFNQQMAFLKIFRAQNFLTEEAPIISMYVSRLIGQADRFRLHRTRAEALAGTSPQLGASPVVVMNFRQPDGTLRATILSFENRGSGLALNYYVVPVAGVIGEPEWSVTKVPSNVSFSIEQGVLRMKLTGPNFEEIIYSGAMQL